MRRDLAALLDELGQDAPVDIPYCGGTAIVEKGSWYVCKLCRVAAGAKTTRKMALLPEEEAFAPAASAESSAASSGANPWLRDDEALVAINDEKGNPASGGRHQCLNAEEIRALEAY